MNNLSLSKIFTGVGICLVAITSVHVFTSYRDYSDKMTDYNNQYVSLRNEVESEVQNNKEITEDDVKTQLHSVKDVGVKIASNANRLQQLSSSGYITSPNYSENDTREEQAEIADVMRDYFGSKTILSTVWFAGDLSMLENQNCWSFMNSYDFSEDIISVLWVCQDDDKNVLAYVTADYHADTDSFDNVSKHVTVIGNTYILPTTGDEDISISDGDIVDNVNQIFDSAGLTDEQKKQQEDAINDEEWQKVKEENNSAKAQLKDALGGDD